jgi:hypothetical protein
MNLSGIIIMVTSLMIVTTLAVYCVYTLLKNPD